MDDDFSESLPTTPTEKKTKMRPKWSSPLEGKLGLIASMLSPSDDFIIATTMSYRGGGFIFLPLLLIFLALIGVPMLLLEVGVGQFSGRGTWCAWNIAPLFKGIGYLVTILNGQSALLFFWVAMAQFVYYYDLISLGPEASSMYAHCSNQTGSSAHGYEDYGESYASVTFDEFGLGSTAYCEGKTIFARRWQRHEDRFDPTAGLRAGNIPDPVQVVAMFLVIFAVCAVVAAGRRILGLFSAVCVLLPMPLRFMLLIRVLTLPGAASGLWYGFIAQGYELQHIQTYTRPAIIALYTVCAAQGRTLTAASYNRFNNNFLMECLLAMVYKVINIIFITITALGMTGALAHATGRDLGDVLTGGVEVVAMATEVLLLHTSAGGFWTSCYLVCVLLSCFCIAVWTAETTVMAVWDLLPQTPRFRQLLRKPALVVVFGLPWLGYSIGYCNKNGWTTVTRAEQAVFGNFTMILICIFECAAIAAVFGARRFQACWSAMQGRLCGCPYPLLFWGIITPIGLTVLLILSLASVHPIMNLLGLTSFVLSLLLVVISALVLLFTRPGPIRQKWRIMTTPWDLAPHQMPPTYGRYETFTMAGVAH